MLGSIPVVGVFVEKDGNWLTLLEADLGVGSVSKGSGDIPGGVGRCVFIGDTDG
jgi:hypothetical protein